MTLIVTAEGLAGRADFRGRVYRCAVGRGGIATDKTEGDGVSPVGEFDILTVLYRPERGAPTKTSVEITPMTATDGWCDEPSHADYNRLVTLPHAASCEKMWRKDDLYNLVAVTSYNSDPVNPNAGSAIFLHLAGSPSYPPTAGCIAFARDDLETILQEWVPGEDRLVIALGGPSLS